MLTQAQAETLAREVVEQMEQPPAAWHVEPIGDGDDIIIHLYGGGYLRWPPRTQQVGPPVETFAKRRNVSTTLPVETPRTRRKRKSA